MTMHATAVGSRVSALPGAAARGRSTAVTLGGTKIVSTANVRIVCGTILLLAALGSVTYLAKTTAPDLAALGIIGTIVASVLAGTFGLIKLDKIDQRVARIQGETQSTVEHMVEQRLSATGQPPLTGLSLNERDS
jgi:hypothetical protein